MSPQFRIKRMGLSDIDDTPVYDILDGGHAFVAEAISLSELKRLAKVLNEFLDQQTEARR